jgi:hypothetical protein
MARTAEQLNGLSIIGLVASDFSYKPPDSIREIPNPFADTLRSFPDSTPGNERSFPVDLARGLPNGIDDFTHRNVFPGDPTAGTFTTIEFDNWVVQKKFDVPGSGFGAVVFRSLKLSIDGKFDYIVAFRGTQGLNSIDWYSNLDLAQKTWEADGRQVINYLRGISGADGLPGLDQTRVGDINFTGQSLGGGLAQYGAYDYARQQGGAFNASNITLITFNAFGGVRGLQLLNGGMYDPNLLESVDTRHFVIDNDIVHRLGAGDKSQLEAVGGSWHVNGKNNTYQFDFLQRHENGQVVLASDGRRLKLSFVDAHRIESGFYGGFANSASGFLRPDRKISINYIDAETSRSYAAWISRVASNGYATHGSAAMRLFLGLTAASASDNNKQVTGLLKTLLETHYASSDVSIGKQNVLNDLAEKFAFAVRAQAKRGGIPAAVGLSAAILIHELGINSEGVTVWGRLNEFLPSGRGIQRKDAIFSEAVGDSDVALASLLGSAVAASQLDTADIELLFPKPAERQVINALAQVGFDSDTLLSKLTSGTTWLQDTLEFLQMQTKESTSAAQTLIDVDAGLLTFLDTKAREIGEGQAGFHDSVVARSTQFMENGFAKALANANSDFTKKHADASNVPFGNTVVDFQSYAFYQKALEGAVRRPELSNIRSLLQDALEIVEGAGERFALKKQTGTNQFDTSGFDPDGIVSVSAKEGRAQLFSADLPYAAMSGGQKIHLKLVGIGANSFDVVYGSGIVALDDSGEFDLVVAESQRSVAFSLIQRRDIDADSDLTLSATLVDSAGNPTHLTHVEANIHDAQEKDSAHYDAANPRRSRQTGARDALGNYPNSIASNRSSTRSSTARAGSSAAAR